MQGVALVDLVGDVVPQNQPGTDQEHPNWRIPLRDGEGQVVLIDELINNPTFAARVGEIIGAVRR
jgi:4-alpha-glucanotransferase